MCTVFAFLFVIMVAAAAFAIGAYMVGGVASLWTYFAIGLATSLASKYLLFSPLKILIWWLIKTCNCVVLFLMVVVGRLFW
jgi:hypothetical protein